MREKVALIRPTLRDEVKEPKVSRFNPDDFPIVSVAVASGANSLRELTTLADQVLKKRLENVRGVGPVTLVGGVKREIKVYLNLEAMEAQGIGADQVIQALRTENQELPAGSIVSASQERIVQIKARLTAPQDFRNLIVARRGGKPVTLGQVAEIEDGQQEEENVALFNGQRTLSHRRAQGAGREHHRGGRRPAPRGARAAGSAARGREARRRARQLDGIRDSVKDVRATLIEGALLTIAHRVPVPELLALHGDHRADAADRADRHLPLHVRVRLHDQHASR